MGRARSDRHSGLDPGRELWNLYYQKNYGTYTTKPQITSCEGEEREATEKRSERAVKSESQGTGTNASTTGRCAERTSGCGAKEASELVAGTKEATASIRKPAKAYGMLVQ